MNTPTSLDNGGQRVFLEERGQEKLRRWLKKILEKGDRGGGFRRDFVMHIISACIINIINGDCFFTILKLLMDVNQTPVYN